MNNSINAIPVSNITTATVWVRRWVWDGPDNPPDGEQLSFEVPILDGLADIADRLKAISNLFYPGWTFDGWHVPYAELAQYPDPF